MACTCSGAGRFTSRLGGVSEGLFAGLNLGAHVADGGQRVWLRIVVSCVTTTTDSRTPLVDPGAWHHRLPVREVAEAQPAMPPQADAAVTRLAEVPLTVMTADCLPVLFCDRIGSVVATAHAGWRGLCDGVLEQTVAAMGVPTSEILAWMGPAIGPLAFEVGDEVRSAFVAQAPAATEEDLCAWYIRGEVAGRSLLFGSPTAECCGC